jgi:hypothetical protein
MAVRKKTVCEVCLLERLANDRELPAVRRDAVTGRCHQNNVTNRPYLSTDSGKKLCGDGPPHYSPPAKEKQTRLILKLEGG